MIFIQKIRISFFPFYPFLPPTSRSACWAKPLCPHVERPPCQIGLALWVAEDLLAPLADSQLVHCVRPSRARMADEANIKIKLNYFFQFELFFLWLGLYLGQLLDLPIIQALRDGYPIVRADRCSKMQPFSQTLIMHEMKSITINHTAIPIKWLPTKAFSIFEHNNFYKIFLMISISLQFY